MQFMVESKKKAYLLLAYVDIILIYTAIPVKLMVCLIFVKIN